MSEQERQQRFIDEYNALVQRYGVQITAQATPEQLGPVVQIRAQLAVQFVPDWKEPRNADTDRNSAAPAQ